MSSALDQQSNRYFINYFKRGIPITVPIAFCIITLGAFANGNAVVGLLFLGIAVLMFTARKGVEVDLNMNRFRNINTYFGIKTGSWKELAAFDFLLISKFQYRTAAPITVGMSASSELIFYDVHLITKGENDVMLFRASNYQLVRAKCFEIAKDLGLRVQELTSVGYIWLE
ncbi:MAG: hypothetical protein R2794_01095 [Chitinophagales bacterium]